MSFWTLAGIFHHFLFRLLHQLLVHQLTLVSPGHCQHPVDSLAAFLQLGFSVKITVQLFIYVLLWMNCQKNQPFGNPFLKKIFETRK